MIKYKVINRKGKEEDWTGLFGTKDEADRWYEKYGKKHEAEGHKLIRVETK